MFSFSLGLITTLGVLSNLLIKDVIAFNCTDGCEISDFYVTDGFCNCNNCEDELYWTCDTCSGGNNTNCAKVNCMYGDYTQCDGTGEGASNDYFYCDRGCPIDIDFYNDSRCDCPSCEDEPDWSCSSCGGCPNITDCGDYVYCQHSGNPTSTPDKTQLQLNTTVHDDTTYGDYSGKCNWVFDDIVNDLPLITGKCYSLGGNGVASICNNTGGYILYYLSTDCDTHSLLWTLPALAYYCNQDNNDKCYPIKSIVYGYGNSDLTCEDTPKNSLILYDVPTGFENGICFEMAGLNSSSKVIANVNIGYFWYYFPYTNDCTGWNVTVVAWSTRCEFNYYTPLNATYVAWSYTQEDVPSTTTTTTTTIIMETINDNNSNNSNNSHSGTNGSSDGSDGTTSTDILSYQESTSETSNTLSVNPTLKPTPEPSAWIAIGVGILVIIFVIICYVIQRTRKKSGNDNEIEMADVVDNKNQQREQSTTRSEEKDSDNSNHLMQDPVESEDDVKELEEIVSIVTVTTPSKDCVDIRAVKGSEKNTIGSEGQCKSSISSWSGNSLYVQRKSELSEGRMASSNTTNTAKTAKTAKTAQIAQITQTSKTTKTAKTTKK